MVGTVGQLSNRISGYIIPIIDSSDGTTEKLNIIIPSGSKLLCTNCTINDEETLISNGSIIETNVGYDFNEELNVVISRDITNKVPLTVLHGREILYADSVTSGTNLVFNLPRGARINQTLVEQTGEVSIATTNKILIEY